MPRRFLVRTLPALLALLVHGRAILFPFMGFDDGMHYVSNPLILHPADHGLIEHFLTKTIGYPMPVTMLTYQVHHVLFGLDPVVTHLVNVVLHALNATLVLLLCIRLGGTTLVATAAGCLFAVHPLVVEPVAWVTGRKDLVATAFALATLVTFVGARAAPGRRRWLGVGALSFLAMLSKPTMVSLPLLLMAAVWERGQRTSRSRDLLACGGLFVLHIAQAVIGVYVVSQQQPVGRASLSERFVSVLAAWALSLKRLVVPVDLVPAYFEWPDDPTIALRVIAIAVLLLLGLAVWRMKRGTPERLALLWAGLAYLPVAGFAGHARWTSDSYLYFPLACLTIALGFSLERIPEKLRQRWCVAILTLTCLCFGGLSVLQAQVWSTPDRVWRAVVARYPKSPVALSELAATLSWMGNSDESLRTYIELDELFPQFEQVILPRVRAREAQGDWRRAKELLAHGVESGDHESAVFYLEAMMANRGRSVSRELAHAAFELAFASFCRQVKDPAMHQRLADSLRQASLPEDASRVLSAGSDGCGSAK